MIGNPQSAPDALFRKIIERLGTAADSLKQIDPEALLVLIVDAGDNAQMEAKERGEAGFVKPLLAEKLPASCRLVVLARTERLEYLSAPSTAQLHLLQPFSLAETARHLRGVFPQATDHQVQEFHRLTSRNPRIQANALKNGTKPLQAVLHDLGPSPTTLDGQIAKQLQLAIDQIRDASPSIAKANIDAICTGLATLPPMVPLKVLAAVAKVNVATIKSFVSDIGRPLWHSDDSVQFLDEPTETWFRQQFSAKPHQLKAFVKTLEPLAAEFTYVAKALPKLLLQSGQLEKLVTLALSDESLPEGKPIDERDVRVYRLRFAFRAALQMGRRADAMRLAFRAGEEVAGNQRQFEILSDNLDLIAPLQDPQRVQELALILVAGKEDFEAASRAKLFSRIATGNWDAVIVTHSGFERIPMSLEAQEDLLKEQINDLQDLILRQSGDKSFVRLVKQLEAAKNRLETRLKILSAEHKKDNTLTFEELGIDRLFVDEAHYFKNLFYVSKMTRIAGLPQTSSQRAFDMFLKIRYLQQRNGDGGVVFATGTPVTNTMAEMYTMQRYLQPADLKRQGLQHFDSWAATFGEPVTAMELSPDGAGYRLNTRFARFVNVPELMQQFQQMADIQTSQMLQLPVPKIFQGKPIVISAPATPELKAFVASLVKRADRLRNGRVDPSEDNMLKITGDGRKAALDLRLVQKSRDHPDSKINFAAREIFQIWEQTKDQRLTQLVFCDLSTPQQGATKRFSAYDDLKAKLVQKGIPTDEIAFIQDCDTDAAKVALFKKVRAGRVRVLMGSTQMMGTGTNVQERLIALHHIDAPWRPADIEQREGRILRQGNKNPEVKIFRYVTEGSFDAYMWGVLETKAKFIGQIMTKENPRAGVQL